MIAVKITDGMGHPEGRAMEFRPMVGDFISWNRSYISSRTHEQNPNHTARVNKCVIPNHDRGNEYDMLCYVDLPEFFLRDKLVIHLASCYDGVSMSEIRDSFGAWNSVYWLRRNGIDDSADNEVDELCAEGVIERHSDRITLPEHSMKRDLYVSADRFIDEYREEEAKGSDRFRRLEECVSKYAEDIISRIDGDGDRSLDDSWC